MRTVLIAASVLMLAGCSLQLGSAPNQPTGITTRTYDAFYPQPNVQVALLNAPPGMTEAQAGPFVAERMKGPTTYGITFTPPGKEAYGDQVATWNFTPADNGVRVEVVLTERGRRMVTAAGTAVSAEPVAITEAIRVLTQQLYAQIVQVRF
ncbi:hypothetical protein [Roseiterribacter gracilis]|uniref:Lipoprotein n=1 Tax=Roseiterribacter gracilis TaxID=2812848 RepID=A0A8S8XA58_9PROT|nr:hypothetical protein TMPK1_11890 [Rhodospirillales bacterium TMPK1]